MQNRRYYLDLTGQSFPLKSFGVGEMQVTDASVINSIERLLVCMGIMFKQQFGMKISLNGDVINYEGDKAIDVSINGVVYKFEDNV